MFDDYGAAIWMLLGLMAVGAVVLLLRKRGAENVRGKSNRSQLFASRYVQDWERHFSWAPVRTIDKGWYWLGYYWRRKIYSPTPAGAVDVIDKHGNVEHSYTWQRVVEVGWYLW